MKLIINDKEIELPDWVVEGIRNAPSIHDIVKTQPMTVGDDYDGPEFPLRYVEDQYGKECDEPHCHGTFQETTSMDDMSGILHCTLCGKRVDRYVDAAKD